MKDLARGLQQPTLYDLLAEADLTAYFTSLKMHLKVENSEHLKFVSDSDLAEVGMSKPEQRRLLKTYQKYYPGSYFGRLKQKIVQKVLPSSAAVDRDEFCHGSHTTRSEQHIIPVDDIVLCQLLGGGEFGSVWQGVWSMPGDKHEKVQVAVKRIIPEKMVANPLDFLQEATIMHRVDHENIVRLYGVVLDPKSIMLVTELAPLRSLAECLRQSSYRASFPVLRLCDYAEQVCSGMAYLESNRLIHRDLAARNILVFSAETVKVADFGLSRALGVGEEYYHSNFSINLKLPIAWCAPECITYLKFTSASDVWAFGVTLWEMFTYGFQPWAGFTGQQILEAINTPKCQRLETPDSCPQEYYSVMLQCWEHDPSCRPRFGDLMAVLRDILPEQVRAIKDCKDNQSDHLNYKCDDIITVLNKRPREYPDGYYWKGVLNCGRTGLFLPENTVSHLNTECPSASPVTSAAAAAAAALSRSTGIITGPSMTDMSKPRSKFRLHHNDAHVAAGLRAVIKDKSKKPLISAPQNDLRHTVHVGVDGSCFGDVSFLSSGTKPHLPRQVVMPFSQTSVQQRLEPPSGPVSSNLAFLPSTICSDSGELLSEVSTAPFSEPVDVKEGSDNRRGCTTENMSLLDEVFEALQKTSSRQATGKFASSSELPRSAAVASVNPSRSTSSSDTSSCPCDLFDDNDHACLLQRDENSSSSSCAEDRQFPPKPRRQQVVKPLSYNDSKMLSEFTHLANELSEKALRHENERLQQTVQKLCGEEVAPTTCLSLAPPLRRHFSRSGRSKNSSSEESEQNTFCSRLPPKEGIKLSFEAQQAYKTLVECRGSLTIRKVVPSSTAVSASKEPTVDKPSSQSPVTAADDQKEAEVSPLRLLRNDGASLVRRFRNSGRGRANDSSSEMLLLKNEQLPSKNSLTSDSSGSTGAGGSASAAGASASSPSLSTSSSPIPPLPPRSFKPHVRSAQHVSDSSFVPPVVADKPKLPPVPPKTRSCREAFIGLQVQRQNSADAPTFLPQPPAVPEQKNVNTAGDEGENVARDKAAPSCDVPNFTLEGVDKYELLNFVLSALPKASGQSSGGSSSS